MKTTRLAFAAILFTAIAIAGDAPSPSALSKILPPDDLIAQVEIFHKDLHEMSSDEQAWEDNSHKVRRDAQTLAAVALMLGLYDSEQVGESRAESGRPPSPQPSPGGRGRNMPAVVDAAKALGEAKDYAAARAALKALDAAHSDESAAGQPLKPGPVGSMGQLMKQAGFANNRLQRGLRRLTDRVDEKARDAAVMAAIAQATIYDTRDVKREDQLEQWYQLCGEMRDRSGQLNAAIRAADKQGADRAFQAIQKSCHDCHAAFRTTK